MSEIEQIVFVDKSGKPTGQVEPKLASHTANTKLHLAFSCYIFRKSDHKFLVTQRALSKKVWPGVWTNSVCGHPTPGEKMSDAILRRAKYELGIDHLDGIKVVLPKYTYTTPPYNGIIENEFCPVHIAYTDQEPAPNPDEVENYMWVDWTAYVHMLRRTPAKMSYWAKDQYKQLKNIAAFRTIVLASGSHRRQELLADMGLQFQTIPSDYEEHLDHQRPVAEVAKELGLGKALDVARHHPEALVIGSDTIVVFKGQQLGKQPDVKTARALLQSMSGQTVDIVTSVALVCQDAGLQEVQADTAHIVFAPYNLDQINAYLKTNDWKGKAAAIAIQSKHSPPIAYTRGSYDTILGLSTKLLADMLQKQGINAQAADPICPWPQKP